MERPRERRLLADLDIGVVRDDYPRGRQEQPKLAAAAGGRCFRRVRMLPDSEGGVAWAMHRRACRSDRRSGTGGQDNSSACAPPAPGPRGRSSRGANVPSPTSSTKNSAASPPSPPTSPPSAPTSAGSDPMILSGTTVFPITLGN